MSMSRGRPVALTIATISVVAAGLLLWLIVQSGDDDSSAATAPPTPTESGDPGARPARGSSSQVMRRERGEADPDVVETVVDGVRIRDHRRDKSRPLPPVAPRQRAPGERQIQPTLTASISKRILPIVTKCGASIPADARQTKPRVEGKISIAVRDQQVSITQATLDVRDVVDSAVQSVKQCISSQLVGLTVPAGEERDLDEYPITLSYPL